MSWRSSQWSPHLPSQTVTTLVQDLSPQISTLALVSQHESVSTLLSPLFNKYLYDCYCQAIFVLETTLLNITSLIR